MPQRALRHCNMIGCNTLTVAETETTQRDVLCNPRAGLQTMVYDMQYSIRLMSDRDEC